MLGQCIIKEDYLAAVVGLAALGTGVSGVTNGNVIDIICPGIFGTGMRCATSGNIVVIH